MKRCRASRPNSGASSTSAPTPSARWPRAWPPHAPTSRRPQRDPATVTRLFDIVSEALPADQAGRTGITVYDTAERPLAWAGRVLDLAKERISGPSTLFVAPGALGPRLVRVEPVVDPGRPGARAATVVVEQSLSGLQPTAGLASGVAVVSTSLVPVSIRTEFESPASPGGDDGADNATFQIPSPTGGLLVEARVSRAALSQARARWRARTWAASGFVTVLALLLCAGPLLDVRRRTRTARVFLAASAAIAVILLVSRSALLWIVSPVAGPQPFGSPANVLLTALAAAALVALAADMLARRRAARPRPRLWLRDDPHAIGDYRVAAAYVLTGAIAAAALAAYERFLQEVVARTNLDVVHFSLHPFSVQGLAVGFGLVLLHAAVLWSAAMPAHAAGVFWRRPRRWHLRATAAIGWLAGAAAAVALIHARVQSIPLLPWLVALAACGACAAAFERVSRRSRRASQASRLVALFVALAVPALAMYPSLFFLATAAKERLIATTYAPQAHEPAPGSAGSPLPGARADRCPAQPRRIRLGPFRVRADDRSRVRRLVEHGARHVPPDIVGRAVRRRRRAGEPVRATSRSTRRPATRPRGATGKSSKRCCPSAPPSATSRRPARASAKSGVIRGAIVVRVMLDYRTLPFISSQNPYLESLRPERPARLGGPAGQRRRVWRLRVEPRADRTSRAPASGRCPTTRSRGRSPRASRFWTTLVRDDERFRVYLTNDRGGIYALGYPVADLVRSSREPRGARGPRRSAVRRAGRLARRCSP